MSQAKEGQLGPWFASGRLARFPNCLLTLPVLVAGKSAVLLPNGHKPPPYTEKA